MENKEEESVAFESSAQQPNSSMTENPLIVPKSTAALPMGDLGQHLPQEIMEGIINLSDRSRQRQSLEREFLVYKEIADRHPQPQFAYSMFLFRRYAEVANDIKDQHQGNEQLEEGVGTSIFNELQSLANYSYAAEVADLSGWNAMKTYTFWFRFFTAIFAFLAVVVMASVPYVGLPDFSPSRAFKSSCSYNITRFFRGTFNMRPYQFIISVGVITYLYSFAMMVYFMLPMDTSRRRIIPGVQFVLGRFFQSPDQIEEIADSLASCLRRLGTSTQLVCDTLLLALMFTAILIASISVERSSPFIVDMYGTVQYYTLGSFYATYRNTNPVCVSNDPCPTLRAALAMSYFAAFIQAISWHGSLQGYRLERSTRESRSTVNIRTLHHVPGENEVVEIDMRALPVPTQGDDERDSYHTRTSRVGNEQVDEVTV